MAEGTKPAQPKKERAPRKEPGTRRAKLSISERLAPIDASLKGHRDAITKLEAKRAKLVAEEAARLSAMQEELAKARSGEQQTLAVPEA